jgi:hypothetical protein
VCQGLGCRQAGGIKQRRVARDYRRQSRRLAVWGVQPSLIATMNEDFLGKARDMGALESGKPVPHYGPSWRTWQAFYRCGGVDEKPTVRASPHSTAPSSSRFQRICIPELQRGQASLNPVRYRPQFFMGSGFYHPTAVEHNDLVRVADGGKPVHDDNRGPIAHQAVQRLLDEALASESKELVASSRILALFRIEQKSGVNRLERSWIRYR